MNMQNLIYLNNHSVNLVWTEFQFVSGETVSKTQSHGHHFLLGESSNQAVSLASDASHELLYR